MKESEFIMRKGYIYGIIFIIIFIIAVGVGYYIYSTNNKANERTQTSNEISNKIVDEGVNTIKNEMTIKTNSEEDKITPNTSLILRKHYNECGHTINEYVEMPSELVNLTQAELEGEYKDWKVEKFTPNEVILIKEIAGNCNEHYVLRPKDGIIAIYKIDGSGNELLLEETGISTEYLTQTDLIKIEQGIQVYGKENLNSIIEDYE